MQYVDDNGLSFTPNDYVGEPAGWNPFSEFDWSGTGAAIRDAAKTAADVAASARQATEDARMAVQATQAEIIAANKSRGKTTGGLNWLQQTWLSASDTEKIFLVLGGAALIIAAVPILKGAIK